MNDPCNTAHLISALMDGELPEIEANRLRRHIRACTACSANLEALVQNDALIRKLPEIEPSEQFDRTFWSTVEAIDRQREKRSWWRFWLSGWRPVAADLFRIVQHLSNLGTCLPKSASGSDGPGVAATYLVSSTPEPLLKRVSGEIEPLHPAHRDER
jgi:anti-sigma factor RsiW